MFKNTTAGHCILMGRKTFESLGRPLPNRTNIVISSHIDYPANGIILKSSIEDGIDYAKSLNEEELFIIGGAQIFKQTFDLCKKIYFTRVHSIFESDTFFPTFNESNWITIKSELHKADEKNKWDFTLLIMERKK